MRNIRNWYQLLEGSGLVANDSGPGAAHGTLTANVTWLPFYSPPRSDLIVSGTLDPDATGVYTLAGYYQSYPYFKHNTTFYLWHDYAFPIWYISALLGTPGDRYWYRTQWDIPGLYVPSTPAAGVPTVACDYTIPYDQKGVIIGPSVSRITSPAAAGFPAAAGSIEMLVRPAWTYTDGVAHFFWDTYGGANKRFLLYKSTAGPTYLWTNSTSRGSFTYPWTAHQLYHIVLNWGTNELFINNALAYNYTDGDLGLGASTLYIGDQFASPNFSFNGFIYYFIARDVALTPAEILAFKNFFTNLYIPQIQ